MAVSKLWPRRLYAGAAVVALAACMDDGGESRSGPMERPWSLDAGFFFGDSTTYGAIDRVVVSEEGVFVADSRFHVVHHFNRDGDLIQVIGREGEGPGEFRLPQAVALYSDGELLVLDRQIPRFAVLELRGSETPGWGRTIPLYFSVFDFCVLGQRIFVLGFHEGHIVHEIDRSGTVLRSFAPVVEEDPFLPVLFASGRLLCSERDRMIVHVPANFPNLRAYDPIDGRELWSSDLPDYHQVIFEVSGNSVRPRRGPAGLAHSLVGVGLMSRDTLLVQLRVTNEERQQVGAPETRVIALADGAQLANWTLPVVAALDNDRFLVKEAGLYPLLRMYQRRER